MNCSLVAEMKSRGQRAGVEAGLLDPDLLLGVGHGILQRHDQDRPGLPVREPGGDGSGEELTDRLADPATAGSHHDQTRVELTGEMLDRERRVADQLARGPGEAGSRERVLDLGAQFGELLGACLLYTSRCV